MVRVELEIHDDAITSVKKIRNTNDTEVELFIPKNSVLFENVINLKIIQNMCDNLGIGVVFNTDDINGSTLIESLNGQGTPQSALEIDSLDEKIEPEKVSKRKGLGFSKPKIKLPKIKIPKIGLLIVLVILGVAAYFGFNYFEDNTRNAHVTILVDSQELTRSLTIRIKSDAETNVAEKVLKGETVSADVEEFAEIETTGEKTVGKKAKGEVKLYNKTPDTKKIKEGTVLYYDDREYEITDDVEVPKYKYVGTGPGGTLIYEPGEKDADIEAKDIGPDYNFDKGEDMDVDDYKESEVTAESKSDIDGGELEKLQVVAQEDIDNLKNKLEEQSKEPIQQALMKKIEPGKELIKGSETTSITKETFSNELDEETDKLTLTETISSKGLVYKKSDIDGMIEELVKDLIPEGFELSDKEKETNIEILGDSTDTVLNFSEADIQVSVKTYVIASIDEESLKERLRSKSLAQAQEIVRNIQNVKNFSIVTFPNIKLLDSMPRNKENIEITIERQ